MSCRAPRIDVEHALDVVRPDRRRRARRGGAAALRDLAERFDGVRPRRCASPPGAGPTAVAALDPTVRAPSRRSIRRARLVHADQRRTDVTTPGRTRRRRSPSAGSRSRRVGLYVPGGLAVYPSQRRHERRPGAGGRGRVARRRVARRSATTAACPHPTILAACALLGVDEVYAVGGAQAVAMFAYGVGDRRRRPASPSTSSPARATSTSPPPSGWCAGVVGIDSEAGPDRDRDPRRRHRRPGARRRRPDQPGRARPAGRRRAGHRRRGARRRGRRRARRGQVAATKHTERIATALARPAVRDRARRRPRRRASHVVDAYGAEHLEIQTARRRRGGRPGPQRRGDLRRPVLAGVARRLLRRVEPRAAHRWLRAALQRAVGVQTFLRGIHVVEYDERALAERRRARRRAGRAPRTCPPTAPRCPAAPTRLDGRAPAAAGAASAARPTARRRCRPVRLNTNENPHPLPPEVARPRRGAVADAVTDLNRYPDRDAERAADRPRRPT